MQSRYSVLPFYWYDINNYQRKNIYQCYLPKIIARLFSGSNENLLEFCTPVEKVSKREQPSKSLLRKICIVICIYLVLLRRHSFLLRLPTQSCKSGRARVRPGFELNFSENFGLFSGPIRCFQKTKLFCYFIFILCTLI